MKVTLLQVYEMEIDDDDYPNKCLDEVINDLNGLYDYKGKDISERCEYIRTVVTEVDGSEVFTVSGNEIILEGL